MVLIAISLVPVYAEPIMAVAQQAYEAGMKQPDPDKLISLRDYKERFKVSEATARRHVRDVEGLAWKIEGRIMIDPDRAAEFYRERRQPQPAWREPEKRTSSP
jgi:hypothetical protein